jgi:prepilin-type N-terminal cleavage/methylation domain-containing protein
VIFARPGREGERRESPRGPGASLATRAPLPEGPPPAGTCQGFTLIELLLVVTILGILGGVAAPHLRSPVRDCKEAALLFNLTEVRTAIERYRAQLDETWPILFATRLTIATRPNGLPGPDCGPYLRHGFPVNPVNESALVKEVVVMPAAPDGSSGWLLVLSNHELRANITGIAPSGKAYFDL